MKKPENVALPSGPVQLAAEATTRETQDQETLSETELANVSGGDSWTEHYQYRRS